MTTAISAPPELFAVGGEGYFMKAITKDGIKFFFPAIIIEAGLPPDRDWWG